MMVWKRLFSLNYGVIFVLGINSLNFVLVCALLSEKSQLLQGSWWKGENMISWETHEIRARHLMKIPQAMKLMSLDNISKKPPTGPTKQTQNNLSI